jgi:hypothetical protein
MGIHLAKSNKTVRAARNRKKLGGILGGIAAFVLVGGGAAFAFVALTSNEATATLEKGAVAQLALFDADFTGPLYPGMSTGLEFKVKNENPFPATIKTIVLSGTSTTDCDVAKLSGAVDVGTVNNLTVTLATPVVVDPNSTKTITYNNALKLAASAPDSCGAVAKFKVTAEGAGPGN